MKVDQLHHFLKGFPFLVAGTAALSLAQSLSAQTTYSTPPCTFRTLAGTAYATGSADGTANRFQFQSPGSAVFQYPDLIAGFPSAAADSDGNVYVADSGDNRIIKITPSGVVAPFAGSGSTGNRDGVGAAAQFNHPLGVAVDGNDNVYVADTGNAIIREITPAGVVTTLASTEGVFNSPQGVAVDGNGNVYVTDANLIWEVTSAGAISIRAGSNSGGATNGDVSNGNPSAASFNGPTGLAVDANSNIYVADTGNDVIREISAAGVVTTLAGTVGVAGSANGDVSNGNPSAASFNSPVGVAVDGSGNVYVADSLNDTIRIITSAGVVTTPVGTVGFGGYINGAGTSTEFNDPTGVAVDGSGNVYVADFGNNTMRKITSIGSAAEVTGLPPLPLFNSPQGVAVDGNGNVYVSDGFNNTIRKITAAGVVTTFAGTAGVTGSADGTGVAAQFNFPYGLAVDGTGNLYVADRNNDTIRKITPDGAVTTVAGAVGVAGSTNGNVSNGNPSAATFNAPSAIAVDSRGNIFVADTLNGVIREIVSTGKVITRATGPGGFSFPYGVAVDASDNVYVSSANQNYEISGGTVTSVAGAADSSPGSTDGAGSAASFDNPKGLAIDGNGNLYVADNFNSTIRKIAPGGVVTTLAGSPKNPGSFDGQPDDTQFRYPSGVAVDGNGNVYVTDPGNNTVREGLPDISLSSFPTSLTVGQSVALNATDSSGYDAFYQVTSGEAVVSGPSSNVITILGTIPAVIEQIAYIPTSLGPGQVGKGPPQYSPEEAEPLSTAADPVGAISVTGPASATPGTAVQVAVTPQDLYGTTIVGSTDTFEFTSSDNLAVLPGESTLANGTGIFNITFNTAGPQTITVTDISTNPEIQIISSQIAVSLPGPPPLTFSQWANVNFTPAESADTADPTFTSSGSTPFNDGVTNLLKYVFDIQPALPMSATDRAALPTVGLDTTTTPGTSYLTLTYREYGQLSPDTTVTVQTSPDLQSWATVTPDFSTQTVLPDGDIMIKAEVNMKGSTKEFIQLKVTQP